MTLKTYKDDYERNKEVSNQLRLRDQKKIRPVSTYLESLSDVKNELDESIAFLEKIKDEPKLLFTHTRECWKSHRDILFKCIDYRSRQTKEGTLHEFQAFLAAKMDETFQDWMQENLIEKDLSIGVRNSNSFPSIYAVYIESKEIIKFNIFEKYYGSRLTLDKEESILQSGQREENRLKEERKAEEVRLEDLLNFKEKPFSQIFSFREFYHIVIRHKVTMKRLELLIKRQEKRLKLVDDRIQRNRDSLPYLLRDNKESRDIYNLIEPFFLQFDYLLEENHSKLY